MLVEGKWVANWQPVQAKDEKGGFVRQASSFRNWVTPDGSAGPTQDGITPLHPFIGQYFVDQTE